MPETYEVAVNVPEELELTDEEIDDLKAKFRADFIETLEIRGGEERPTVQIIMPRPGGSGSKSSY